MQRITPLIPLLLAMLASGCASNQSLKQPLEPSKKSEQSLVVMDQYTTTPAAEDNVPEFDNIWPRIISAYRLNINVSNPRITSQLNWYKSHQGYLNRVADRGIRYLHFIAEQIDARQLPGELALLPIVESAFDPFAYSHGRASGVWQFIPATGRDFGLHQDWWHDGRRDIRAATEGALKYLNALQREFDGDWLLALAAYNSGAGTVRKAIRKNRRKGLATDFWSLALPKETRAYVPKLIALAKLVKEPARYGVALKPIANKPYFAIVNTGGQIDLSQAAELADTSLEEIYRLNPEYNRWATHPSGPHELLIPVDKQSVFQQQLASMPASSRVKWQRYEVKSGDSLLTIARRFRTTPDALKQANGLRGNVIRAGEPLLIPGAFKGQNAYSHSVSQRMARLKTARRPGNTERQEYSVRSGDSFWQIARNHDVKVSQLARWNGMAPGDPLKTGQKLVIWSKKSQPNKREVIRKVNYRVRSGDSLARISQKFNVRVSDIRRWNSRQTNNKYLQPGQKLTLYVDVTR